MWFDYIVICLLLNRNSKNYQIILSKMYEYMKAVGYGNSIIYPQSTS